MAFSLAGKPKERKLEYISDSNLTDEIILEKYEHGYSRVRYKGGSFFVNMDDEYEQYRVQEAIGVPNYKWFRETTGNHNWVLFNPKQYNVEYNSENRFILKFNAHDYDGLPLQLPINASSCCSMFSWLTLPEDFVLHRNFVLDNIVDASMMFAGCVFSANFEFDFDTTNLYNMRYMFFQCKFGRKDFLKKLNTTNAVNLAYMFGEAELPNGFEVDIDTTNVQNMTKMFFNTIFNGKSTFGDKFNVTGRVTADNLFQGATLNGKELSNYTVPKALEMLAEG